MTVFTVLEDIWKFFEGTPSGAQAAADLKTAAASAEAAVVPTIDAAANAALALIPFGSLADGIVDSLINGVIAKLEAKLSTAVDTPAPGQ